MKKMPNMIDKRKPVRRHIRMNFNNKDVEKIPNLSERKSHKGVRSRLINFSTAVMNLRDIFSVSKQL